MSFRAAGFCRLTMLGLLAGCLAGCGGIDGAREAGAPVKSPNDRLDYRYLRLDNGLQVLLISDPDTDKSAAALDVLAGSAQDPADRQGLAHFLEHMLFLGTDKYPDPGEYQAHLNERGGRYNAYTSFRHTNYFFDIDPDYFDEGLDRFSRFFVAPLFNSEYVEREKHAVHSEYQARIKNDSRRQLDVFRQLSNPAHPVSGFGVGSLETLAERPGQSVRGALLDFYSAYYSADRMALAILSRDALDEQEAKIRRMFGAVPRRDAASVTIAESLFAVGQLPRVVHIEPVQDIRELSLLFPVPDNAARYREKSLSYLSNLLGHEGGGSLLALLKSEGLAEGLSAGAGFRDGNQSVFQITVSLTPAGRQNWSDVVALVFDQIDLIRSAGIKKWRYREQARLADIRFRFVEKSRPINYVSRLASQMHDFPSADILRGPYRMDQYHEQAVRGILDGLNPDNVLVSLLAPGVATDSYSPFYNAPYRVLAVSDEQRRAWRNAAVEEGLRLPPENPYIPQSLALADVETDAEPVLLERDAYSFWLLRDTSFNVPRAHLRAAFKSRRVETAEGAAMTALLLSVIEENLKSETYPAALAGLNYSFSLRPDGFGFAVGGFDDRLAVLLQRLVAELENPGLRENVVVRVRDGLARNWRNTARAEPYLQVWDKVPQLLEATRHDPLVMADALRGVTVGQLAGFAAGMFDASELTLLVGGNVTEKEGRGLARTVARLASGGNDVAASIRGVLRLSESHVSEIAIDHADTALIRYYQGRDGSLRERGRFLLLRQLLKAPFYNELRTEQQLGYVVAAVDQRIDRVPGIGLLVQSPVAGQAAIEKAMAEFLRGFPQRLADMDEAELQTYRTAVIATLKEKPENLAERVARDWNAIDLNYLGFDTREKLISLVSECRLADVRSAFAAVFLEGNRWLQVVNVHGREPESGRPRGVLLAIPAQ